MPGGVSAGRRPAAQRTHVRRSLAAGATPPALSLLASVFATQEWLVKTQVPPSLRTFVLHGEVPPQARERLAAVGLAN